MIKENMATNLKDLLIKYPILMAQYKQEILEDNTGIKISVETEQNKDGFITLWTEIIKDRDNKQISKRVDSYKYDNDKILEIILRKYGNKNTCISTVIIK